MYSKIAGKKRVARNKLESFSQQNQNQGHEIKVAGDRLLTGTVGCKIWVQEETDPRKEIH